LRHIGNFIIHNNKRRRRKDEEDERKVCEEKLPENVVTKH